MRILVHSTSPHSPSSYSVLTKRVVPELVRGGHQVAVSTWYGLQGQPLPWRIPIEGGEDVTTTIFPSGDGPKFSQDILPSLYQFTKADACLVISDVWPFDTNVTSKTNFVPWFPVDHDPVPNAVLTALEPAVLRLCYSKWGTRLTEDAGLECRYVPCGADSKIFCPGDQAQAREELAITDKCRFLVVSVAANKDPADRKGLVTMLRAFTKFAENHDDAYYYLHTNYSGAIDIRALIKALGIKDRIIQPDPLGYRLGMLSEQYMVNVYRAANVLLNLPKSEGFGLPLLESQLCGTPVVATDFSTTEELLWAGWKVGGEPSWTGGAMNSWVLSPSADQGAEALEEAYRARNNKTLRRQARKGALTLDIKRTYIEHWQPALAELERRIKPPVAVTVPELPEMVEAEAAA